MKRVAVAGALVFAAAHLPFLPPSLEDVDSINFALGIRDFDVAQHQPHPPGYPLFIAAGKFVHAFVPSDAHALAVLSVICAALALVALVLLYRRIDGGPEAGVHGILATVVAATCPLYWFTAVRPLSDMAGLATALAVQALTLAATTERMLLAATFLAAFGAGIRSQVFWLTAPLIVWQAARLPSTRRAALGARVLAAFAAGGLAWGVPLVLFGGGPGAYWRALFSQGAEDLGGVVMLWTTPTARELLSAMYYAFAAPWAVVWVAVVVLAIAAAGLIRLARFRPDALATLAVAFGPYLIFDIVFQETITTRYSLPNVIPLAFLAVWGLGWLTVRPAAILAILLAAFNAHVGGTSVAAYAKQPAPAFRLIGDLQAVHAIAPALRPVIAMHRREAFDLRRPIAWAGAAMPPVERQLPSPPKHEWLELVKYWNGGGRDLVWFFADPLRTDLALVEHAARPNGSYRWPLPYPVLLGGVRPDGMDWYALSPPGWYLGEGWALTPEVAGVALEDGRGPGRAPIQGWIRRRGEPVTMVFGGRNLSPDIPVRTRVAIDGRTVEDATIAPGFFLKFVDLQAGALAGSGDYATVTVSADAPPFAVEQFDAQASDRVVFGFGDGWQEPEYNPSTGLSWRWMSERATLRVHAAGRAVVLTIAGDPPSVYFRRPSHVRISAAGRLIAEADLFDSFSLQVTVPAGLLPAGDAAITIETDQMYVPAERSRRSPDRRHLALRVFSCRIEPAS